MDTIAELIHTVLTSVRPAADSKPKDTPDVSIASKIRGQAAELLAGFPWYAETMISE